MKLAALVLSTKAALLRMGHILSASARDQYAFHRYEQAFFSLVVSELHKNYQVRYRLNHTETNFDIKYIEKILHDDEKMRITCSSRKSNHDRAQRTSEIFFLPQEHKIHIFDLKCNFLFIIWTINIHGRD